MGKVRYKKPDAVLRLEGLALKGLMEKHPNFPYPVKPKYRDDNSNALTKCIIDAISFTNYQAERINATGTQIKTFSGTKWVKGSCAVGTADISATIKGKSVKIEVKCKATGDKYQSQAQKEYQAQIEKAGGTYIVIGDFTEFYNWYCKFLKTNK
jgi:hypothetical protein